MNTDRAESLVDEIAVTPPICPEPRLDIDRHIRAALKSQIPAVLWFTGLSGAGKSTIANNVDVRLTALHRHTFVLDGDSIRHGLCRDLGFSHVDRDENVRRVAEVAKLMADAGLIVIVSMISPLRAQRQTARSIVGPNDFVEIFVDTPLSVAEARDPKGLYRKARNGEIRNFTGIDAPYERPEDPHIHLESTLLSPAQAAARVVTYLMDSRRAPLPSTPTAARIRNTSGRDRQPSTRP